MGAASNSGELWAASGGGWHNGRALSRVSQREFGKLKERPSQVHHTSHGVVNRVANGRKLRKSKVVQKCSNDYGYAALTAVTAENSSSNIQFKGRSVSRGNRQQYQTAQERSVVDQILEERTVGELQGRGNGKQSVPRSFKSKVRYQLDPK